MPLVQCPAQATECAPYTRFAGLTANQKTQARKIYSETRSLELVSFGVRLTDAPLVDCWFLANHDDTVSTFGFFVRDPRNPRLYNLRGQY